MTAIRDLERQCSECRRCPLYETRTNLVFSAGNPTADIMFIGEAPGEQEDLRAEPFVGRAGLLLDDMLSIFNFSRNSNIYIANILKCRPPANRDPLPAEQDACFYWLAEQIKLVNPSIIVCLGRIAAKRLISQDFKITQQQGQWFSFDNRLITAIYHPAALLRNPHNRPDAFVALKAVYQKFTGIRNMDAKNDA